MSDIRIEYNSKNNQWTWHFKGDMPIVNLIGYVVNLQGWLLYRKGTTIKEEGLALIIQWDGTEFSYKVNPGIRVDGLIGSLEIVKQQLVDSQLAAMHQEQMRKMAAQQERQLIVPPPSQPELEEMVKPQIVEA